MATSGTYGFSPTLAQILDEAWERCGRDPAEITGRHIVSALRSFNLLLTAELSNDQINLWKVEQYIPTTPALGATSFALPAGVIDVVGAITRDGDDIDTPMVPTTRDDWLQIPDKAQQGRPDRYWVDRTTGTKTLYFWQAQPTTAYDIVLNVLYRMEDAGDLTNTADLPDLWQDVACAGLASRLAEKWAPERADRLEAKYAKALAEAKRMNREQGSLHIEPCYGVL